MFAHADLLAGYIICIFITCAPVHYLDDPSVTFEGGALVAMVATAGLLPVPQSLPDHPKSMIVNWST